MEERVQAIIKGDASECIWFLEHPSLYTLGTSADKENEILDIGQTPLFETGRGGKITYHGPGQRVIYVMLNLKARRPDLKKYIYCLEEWVIRSLKAIDVVAERRENRIGLWVPQGGTEKKIAAIGVRLKKWVSSHGIALNINPDLRYFQKIIPCGLQNYGVTSLEDLGLSYTPPDFDAILRHSFEGSFDIMTP